MAKYTTKVGNYLVIWITGAMNRYIAEVVEESPLVLKVKESGPYSRLKSGDFIIKESDCELIQKDIEEETCVFVEREIAAGRVVVSGLASLGVEDDQLHEITPD